jgi:hypothetical protein
MYRKKILVPEGDAEQLSSVNGNNLILWTPVV